MEDEHPLFMDKLPENPEDNPILSSLQNLLYEGPPDEVATGFKSLGNQQIALKTKKGYTEAVKFYTQGLDVQGVSSPIRVQLFGNRAQAQLEMKNYGHALKDCVEALKLAPTDMKANWRAGRATFALGRFEEAVEYLQKAKDYGGDARVIDVLVTQSEAQRTLAAARPAPTKSPLPEILASRGIKTRKLEVELPYPFEITMGEDGLLRFPIIFLYDQPVQSDYVEAMREDETFGERLAEVLPPPWDEGQLFSLESTRVFYQKKNGHGEVAMRDTIGAVVTRKDYLMPQLPVFHLVSAKTDYIREFL